MLVKVKKLLIHLNKCTLFHVNNVAQSIPGVQHNSVLYFAISRYCSIRWLGPYFIYIQIGFSKDSIQFPIQFMLHRTEMKIKLNNIIFLLQPILFIFIPL